MDLPDKKTKNEIDHLLVNDVTIIKDVAVIRNFEFLSDHRPVRCSANIRPRARYRNNILKNCNLKEIIPKSRQEKVNKELREYLQYIKENRNKEEVTSLYDKLEGGLKGMYKIYGIRKPKETTKDKITLETLELIKKGTE